MKIWILLLMLLPVACGVKGAPAPRQNSAYIFNPDAQDQNDEEKKEDGQSKRRSNNRSNNSIQN